jgi:hypothetical protein
MSIRFSVEVEDHFVEELLRYLDHVFGDNEAHKLSVLSCARQWLELEDKTPPIFTRDGGHVKRSALSVAEDCEDASGAFSPSQMPSLRLEA